MNVQDALAIGSEQTKQFSASLSSDFHEIMKKKLKSMVAIRKAVYVMSRGRPSTTSKPCSVGCWSWVISNNMAVADVLRSFQQPTLVDEYGCFRKGATCMLVKCLRVCDSTSTAPDVVLVDAGELLHHVVWPVIGIAEDWLQASALDCPTTILFPQFIIIQDATNTKDHKRTRRGIARAVRLTPNALLPCQYTVLHNTTNNCLFNGIPYGSPRQCNTQLVNNL